MSERASAHPRSTHLHHRGEYLQAREAVTPDRFHHSCRHCRPDAPPNRLGFAKWLVSPENPADRSRRGQSALGSLLRPRPGADDRGFRVPGRFAVASGPARLAGGGVHAPGLVAENSCTGSSSRAQLTSSPVPLTPGPARARPGEYPSCARAAVSRRRRNGAGCGAGASGLLCEKIGGPSVFPPQPPGVTTEGAYGDAEVDRQHGGGSLSPGALHVCQAHRALRHERDLRRPERRSVSGASGSVQHAAAGADLAQRHSVHG